MLEKKPYGKNTHMVDSRRPLRFTKRFNVFKQTPFVNMGLLEGKKRSGGGSYGLIDREKPESQIGVRYRELIKQSPPSLKEKLHRMFINKNRDLLNKAAPIPWYMPSWIGGLGLTGIEEPSELDLRLAQRILFNWRKRRPIDLAKINAPWKTWQLAEKAVPEPMITHSKNDGVEYYTRVVATKCIDLLFDSNINLETLMPGTSKIGKGLARNKQFWRPPKGALPEPIEPWKLLFQSAYSTYETEVTPNPLIHPLD
jgi:hypothetical protein